MVILTERDYDALLPFWKPEENIEYKNVVLSDWQVKVNKNFNKRELSFNVLLVDNISYNPPKEFNTSNSSFIKTVWPMIQQAQREGRSEIYLSILREAKKYVVADKTPKVATRFGGVRVE